MDTCKLLFMVIFVLYLQNNIEAYLCGPGAPDYAGCGPRRRPRPVPVTVPVTCGSGYYRNGGGCSRKKKYGYSCSRSIECKSTHCVTVSEGSRCLCSSGYYWTGLKCNYVSDLAPTSVRIEKILTTSVSLRWTAPVNSAYISGYRVDATPTDARDIDPPSVKVQGTSVTLTGLQPGTRYKFLVESKRVNEEREEYVKANYLTRVTKPVSIKGLYEAKSNYNAPEMTIVFKPAIGRFTGYIVTLRGEGADTYYGARQPMSTEDYFRVVFQGVTAGNHYILTVVTNSYKNTMSEPFTTRIRVLTKPSGPVEDCTFGTHTSRSVVVSWKRPKNPNGLLNGYSLEINKDGSCVSRTVFNCSDCTGHRVIDDTTPSCPVVKTMEITETDISNKDYVFVFNVANLNPDTSYEIAVSAYNEEGRGLLPNSTLIRTDEEAAQAPRSVTLKSKTSNSVTLSWVPETPRPGVTTYIIAVFEKAKHGGEFIWLRNETVFGYYNTSMTVYNLSSYWDHKFSVQARTVTFPPSEFVHMAGVVTTEESAPTAVLNLVSKRTPSGQIQLSWFCPPQKDGRNGVIKSATVISGLSGNVKSEQSHFVYPVTSSCSWNQTLDVTAEFNYTFQVYLSNSFDGRRVSISKYLEALPPPLKDSSIPILQSVSQSEATAVLDVCTSCYQRGSLGNISKSGLLVCRLGNCRYGDPKSRNADFYDSLANWDKAKGDGFKTFYRTTDNNWLNDLQLSVNTQFILGEEKCSLADQNRFCNGPLPVGHTFRVWLFACTQGGCSESVYVELKMVTDAISLPTSTIVAIVAVVVVVANVVVLVVVYVRIIRPKSKKTDKTKTTKTDDTYEDVLGVHDVKEVKHDSKDVDYYNTTDLRPCSENMYEGLAIYENGQDHNYSTIKVTSA